MVIKEDSATLPEHTVTHGGSEGGGAEADDVATMQALVCQSHAHLHFLLLDC